MGELEWQATIIHALARYEKNLFKQMKLFFKLLFAVACVFAGMNSHARTIRICIPNENFDPVVFVDHDGDAQSLVRKALEQLGDSVEFVPVPNNRCFEGLKTEIYDAALPAAALPIYFDFLQFPLKNNNVDPDYSVASLVAVAVRRVNNPANWDGITFSNTDRPILMKLGMNVIREKVMKLGLTVDEGSYDQVHTLRKLLFDRGNIAILIKNQAEILIYRDEFQGKIEILPIPFINAPLYLAFSKLFYKKSPGKVEAIWSNIKNLRKSDSIKAHR